MTSKQTKQEVMEEEEIKPSTSLEQQVMQGTSGWGGEESTTMDIDSDIEFDNKYIAQYCDTVDMPIPMTISKELFYTDNMVAKHYEKLPDEDKARFDQMKDLAEAIKRDTGDYGLIEDLMAWVVAQYFGQMKKEDVASVMGKEGEGVKGGKGLEQVGGRLQIKNEPGPEPDKIIVTAIIPAEEASLIPYHIVEDEGRSDCFTIGSEDSDIEEIDRTKVKSVLKERAELKHKEAQCIDCLAEAVPDM